MTTGIIKRFDFRKGFGFIIDDESGKDFFFHKSAWNGDRPIRLGLAVEFVSKESEKGPQAEAVRPTDADQKNQTKAKDPSASPASLEDRIASLEGSLALWKTLTLLALAGVVALALETLL